jgi:hypothetical protein
MKKILLISEGDKRSLMYKLIESIFANQDIRYAPGIEVEKIINEENPDFVLIDKIKPVNGMDMMSVLRHVDGNIRLRVAIFYLSFFKKQKAIKPTYNPLSN